MVLARRIMRMMVVQGMAAEWPCRRCSSSNTSGASFHGHEEQEQEEKRIKRKTESYAGLSIWRVEEFPFLAGLRTLHYQLYA